MDNPYPINTFLRLIVKMWMTLFTWYYKISANISPELKNFNQPYILLSNHYGRYDPFIISHFIKQRPNFISSDAILRDKIIGTLFKGLGAMPKKKGVRDSHIIREMVKVVQSGGALSLFPEGTRTWSGETQFMDPSIAKLVKLLKVPVITARMKGAYAFDPRWAKSIRRAKVEIDYKMAIAGEAVSNLSEDEILAIIRGDLYHDDIEYQRLEKIKIESGKRAEHIDLVLFQCPGCLSFAGFNDYRNQFSCADCGNTYSVDDYGFLAIAYGEPLPFDDIKEWLNWQNNNFIQFMTEQISQNISTPLFHADNMQIEYAVGDGRMHSMGIGRIYFYLDKLKIITGDSEEELLISEISALGPQFNERIELFYQDRAYRFTTTGERVPGIKWEIAINVLWASTGLDNKLAPYFKDLVKSFY
jgi:1-acyl-sn-glycerol-3-phosphate acyltransferase